MLFSSLGGYVLKISKDKIFFPFFSDYSYESYKI